MDIAHVTINSIGRFMDRFTEIPAVTGCVQVASVDDFGYLAMCTAVAHAGSMTTDSASTHQHAVDTLRAALDEIELGTVLLDSNLNVQFVNSAFLRTADGCWFTPT